MYILIPALWVALFLALVKRGTQHSLPLALVSWFGLGLLVGNSGLLFALSWVVVIPALVLIFRATILQVALQNVLFFMSGLGAGVAVSLTSSGARARRDSLDEPNYVFALADAIRSFPATLADWLSSLASVSSAVAFLVGVLLWGLVRVRDSCPREPRFRLVVALYLVAHSLAIFLTNSFTEGLVYEAHWHTLTAEMMIFVASAVFGFQLSPRIASLVSRVIWPIPSTQWLVAGTALAGLILVLAAGSVEMWFDVINRERAWVVGPAPIAGAGDLDELWVRTCASVMSGPEMASRLQ